MISYNSYCWAVYMVVANMIEIAQTIVYYESNLLNKP